MTGSRMSRASISLYVDAEAAQKVGAAHLEPREVLAV
jgi:hypothetical protein